MKDSQENKIRLLKIWEILKSETDPKHPIDSVALIKKLQKEGLSVERKTLYDDIKLLNKYGFEVVTVRSRKNMYYVADRSFDEAEIRMLVDAVFSANFITTSMSEKLAEKLMHLVSKRTYSSVMATCTVGSKDKKGNEQIWNTIDKINSALQQGKKMKFKYFDYDYNVNRIYRKQGRFYDVNPVGLIFNEGNYYLVAFGDKYKQVANYRVDRMDLAEVSELDAMRPYWVNDFDLIKHRSESFSMFPGKTYNVQLLCDNSLTDVMFDRFGYDINANKFGDHQFFFRTPIQVSPMFFQWLVTFGDKIKIIDPLKVKVEFVEYLQGIVNSYGKI